MKNYTFQLTTGPKNNDGINFRTTKELTLTKNELLKLKRSLLKDKKQKYSIVMLEGGKEPLLRREKLQIFFKKITSYLWIH